MGISSFPYEFQSKSPVDLLQTCHLKYVRPRGLTRMAPSLKIRTKCLGHDSEFPFRFVGTSNLYRLLTCLRILNSIIMLKPIGEHYSQMILISGQYQFETNEGAATTMGAERVFPLYDPLAFGCRLETKNGFKQARVSNLTP